MSIKRLGVTVLVVVALGGVAASSAFATNNWNETGSAWYTGASPGTKLTGTKAIEFETEGKLVLTAPLTTRPLKIEVTGGSCVGCLIENSGTNAVVTGALELTGVTLVEPEPSFCTTPSTITTNPLRATVGMKRASFTVSTMKFVSTLPSIATIQIVGPSCPFSGLYKLTGAIYAESEQATGTFSKRRTLTASRTIQEDAGEAISLKLGANGAILSGKFCFFLSPEAEWAAKES